MRHTKASEVEKVVHHWQRITVLSSLSVQPLAKPWASHLLSMLAFSHESVSRWNNSLQNYP